MDEGGLQNSNNQRRTILNKFDSYLRWAYGPWVSASLGLFFKVFYVSQSNKETMNLFG
jgi:hypothetical protein